MKSKILYIGVLFLLFLGGAASTAAGVTLAVENVSGSASQSLAVPVTVDNPASLAGAAFTLQYDASLTVRVESTFFDTFYNQFDKLTHTGPAVDNGDGPEFPLLDGAGDPLLDENNNPVYVPARVTVGDQSYDQPLIDDTESADSRVHHHIAAARCLPASPGEDPTLFTLYVSLDSSASSGSYSIDIVPTIVNDSNAGYDPAGETVDLLIGSDLSQPLEGGNAFPVLLDDAGYETNVSAGTIVFIDDADNDGLNDRWETHHFSDLSHDGTADSDGDGYTDYWEYRNETDPNDNTTAVDLEGYVTCTDARFGSPLPVINNFSANPATIELTENAVLIWSIIGADSALIDNGIDSVNADAGSKTVSPETTTTYTLTATNGCGTATRAVTVTVDVNYPPAPPELLSPANGAEDVPLMPELETAAYVDPEGDVHVQTRWQIAEGQDFDDDASVVYDEITAEYLTRIVVPPDLVLEKDTVYFWRVLFSDGNAWSAPSEVRSFTTVYSGPAYIDGIREESRIGNDEEVRVGSNFTAIDGGPVNTPTRKVLRSATDSGVQVGIRAEGATIDKCGALDPANFADKVDILPDLPFGLFEIALEVAKGDSAEVTFHFTEPLEKEGFVWWKYDPNQGVFYDYEAEAGADVVTVNDDGSVTLRFEDGGYGDLIDNPDGRIIDPGGPGAIASGDSEKESGGGGGGGCFIDTLLR